MPEPVLQPVEAGPPRAADADRVGPAVDLVVVVAERAVGRAQRLVLQVRGQPVALRGRQVAALDGGGQRARSRDASTLSAASVTAWYSWPPGSGRCT